VADLTDEQRLEVCRELRAFWVKSGRLHLDQALFHFEEEAKQRLAQAETERSS
jgi:hypothetical protein